MGLNLSQTDALIFDMDGTLWDATDSYVASWNLGLEKYGLKKRVQNADLMALMGLEEPVVFQTLFPDLPKEEHLKLASLISQMQDICIPAQGGTLYEGVYEGLEKLSKKYKLFVVSNCPENTVSQFITWAKIDHLIIDQETFGRTRKPKSENIKMLIARNNLKNPVYIGDTKSDQKASKEAGLPFLHVLYGFGESVEHEPEFKNFPDLVKFLLSEK